MKKSKMTYNCIFESLLDAKTTISENIYADNVVEAYEKALNILKSLNEKFVKNVKFELVKLEVK